MLARVPAFLLIAVFTVTAQGDDWSVPTGFHGVEFFATREEAEAILGRLQCRDVKAVTVYGHPVRDRNPAQPAPAHVACSTTDREKAFRIGRKAIDVEYLFDRGRFVAVRFPSPEKLQVAFADILSQFESEYGQPSRKIDTARKGMREEMVVSANRHYQSAQQVVPAIYDYAETCVHWTNAPVTISICSEDRMFRRGLIDTAEWWLRKQELIDNLPDDHDSRPARHH